MDCGNCGTEFEPTLLLVDETLCEDCTALKPKKLRKIKYKDLSWQKSVIYTLVDTQEAFDKLLLGLDSLPKDHPIGLDTETTGLFTKKAHIVGLSMSWKEAESYYIPIRHKVGTNLDPSMVLSRLAERFDKHSWVFANAKYDCQILYMATGKWIQPFSDVLLLRILKESWILEKRFKGKNLGLKAYVRDYYGIEMQEFEDIVGTTGAVIDTKKPKDVYMYASADADFTRRLHFTLMEKMVAEKHPALRNIYPLEMRLSPIIAKTELRGVSVDLGYVKEVIPKMRHKLETVKKEFFALLKTAYKLDYVEQKKEKGKKNKKLDNELDLNSPVQLIDLFYKKLKLPEVRNLKTKELTIGKDAFNRLGHKFPIVAKYHEFSTTQKIIRDFLLKIEEKSVDGIMYFSLKQMGTNTQRMSCVSVDESVGVNMQQVPKAEAKEEDLAMRRVYRARDGYYFIDCDYSQIELKVFASESKAEKMLEAIYGGIDIHTATASSVFSVPVDGVEDYQRQAAKGVNFTLTYGGTYKTIALRNRMPMAEAQQMYCRFFEDNPSAKLWMYEREVYATNHGCITTKFGRKVCLSSDFRKAVNYTIQSGTQDIYKFAIVRCDKVIENLKKKYGDDAINMLLFVHDEILFEVRNDIDVKEVSSAIKQAMEFVVNGYCPITTSQEYGKNWAELKPVNLEGFVAKEVFVPEKPSTEEETISLPETKNIEEKNTDPGSEGELIKIGLMKKLSESGIASIVEVLNSYPGNMQVVLEYCGKQTAYPKKVGKGAFLKLSKMLPMPLGSVILTRGDRLIGF